MPLRQNATAQRKLAALALADRSVQRITSPPRIRLSEAARQAFPNKVLAQGEIMRRFSLSGVQALKGASDAEKKKVQREHQATMTVAGREGEKPNL